MRIARLGLARYGHLADVELHFPAGAGLHVVLGANEAGKSTALSAIGDALFGFPHRTPYAFLHDQADLRVALDLTNRDGAAISMARAKRRKDDLTDASGAVVSETALAPFLGGATRAVFERMFGLNGAELRRGGNDMLEGKGEVGASIFEASTGLRGLSLTLEKIREQAKTLYTPSRAASRAFYQITEAFRQASRDREARSIRPETYEQQRAEQAHLTGLLAVNAEQDGKLNAERRRLERIRRTLPALRALEQARAGLLALGDVPALPPDAARRRESAILERKTAIDALDRDVRRREVLAGEHAALSPDRNLLRDAEAIDALSKDLRRIEGARADRGKRDAEFSQHARAILQAGRDLGLDGQADEIAARLPTRIDREAARRVLSRRAGVVQLLATATEARDSSAHAATAADTALAAADPPADATPLRQAIDAARAEGRLDDDLFRARDDHDAAGRERARVLATLSLWQGDAASLAAAPIPAPATIRAHTAALTQAETAARDARREIDRLKPLLAEAEDRLTALTQGESLPTESAISNARDRRDHVWRIIRRHHVDGGAAPTPHEQASLGVSGAFPDALDSLLREADRLADRRATEAKRLSDFDQGLATRARLDAEQARTVQNLRAAEVDLQEKRARWIAAWAPTGIEPTDPAAMTEWLSQRKLVVDALAREDEAAARLRALESRHATAWADLSAHMPERPPSEDRRLRTLLRDAEALWVVRDAADQSFRALRTAAKTARDAAEKAARDAAQAMEKSRAWEAEWAAALTRIRLPSTIDAADAESAIGTWERIATEAQAWELARGRIAEMTAEIDAYAAQVADIAGRVAPDLMGQPPNAVVPLLAARLAEAREQAKEKTRLAGELQKLESSLAATREKAAAAASQIEALCALAGADDDEALAATIVRAGKHADLVAETQRCLRELRAQGDGLTPEHLRDEAEGADPDALATRIDAIDRALGELRDASLDAKGKLVSVEAELHRMETGLDAAEAAQRMENLAAEAAETAARYVRLRLASECLRAGLEKFRREQQGPLLSRAGEHFSRLSISRYARLEIIEDDKGVPAIVAVRPDGTRCPVPALSEGTRDQLYLALRIAAIEEFCDRAEPLPFIADDLLVNFDDARARAALAVLADLGSRTQTILFTHHDHIAAMVDPGVGLVHLLPAPGINPV